ncbi:hypothetical protein Tco_0403944 [Tanacetum coccineum]
MSAPNYIYPIIVPSYSNVEDAFSSTHSPDYIPASPDYFPASPGNTSPDPSDDLSKYLLASLAISPFHDDPYMKVMQAYNATSNESPIPLPQAPIAPPTALPPSPMFDPQDFFLPEEILPPQKRARFLSPSSTDFSTPPQVFKIGESYYKTHLERYEEHIKTILNHLDELPLGRIEHMEDKIEGLEFPRLWRAQAATMANADNTNRNTGPREAPVARKCSYKEVYELPILQISKVTEGVVGLIRGVERTESLLTEEALSWWNSFAQPIGIEEAYKITWQDLMTYVRKYQKLASLYAQLRCKFLRTSWEDFIGIMACSWALVTEVVVVGSVTGGGVVVTGGGVVVTGLDLVVLVGLPLGAIFLNHKKT